MHTSHHTHHHHPLQQVSLPCPHPHSSKFLQCQTKCFIHQLNISHVRSPELACILDLKPHNGGQFCNEIGFRSRTTVAKTCWKSSIRSGLETPLDKTMWYSSSSSAYGFWLDTDLFRMICSCPSGSRMWVSPINFTAVAAQMNSLPDLCTSALRSIRDGQVGGMLRNSSHS